MKWSIVLILFILTTNCLAEDDEVQPTFRIIDSFRAGYLDFIIEEFERRGYEIGHPALTDWNVTWSVAFPPSTFLILKDWQKVNNMPGIAHLTTKDNLHRSIENMKKKHKDDAFSFWPESYNLEDPKQFEIVRKIFEEHENQITNEPLIFIIKKPMRPRGLGVHLVHNLAEIDDLKNPTSTAYPLEKTKPIAQRYITDVLTIAGHKVTFRVYAVITSLDPLRVYVYPNGLGRICSRRYSTDIESLKDQWVHIDSINLNEENEHEWYHSVNGSDLVYEGLRVYDLVCEFMYPRLENLGVTSSASKVWSDIKNVVLMSFFSAEKIMHSEYMRLCVDKRKRRTTPFELVGFDILLDKNLKPWLLEINNTPSMAPHTTMENDIKKNLLRELFDLVDIQNLQFNVTDSIVNEKWKIIKSLPPNSEFVSKSGEVFPVSLIKTKEDLWTIVETELENARAGNFETLFPVPDGKKYLIFLANKRNDLLVAWKNLGMTLDDIKA